MQANIQLFHLSECSVDIKVHAIQKADKLIGFSENRISLVCKSHLLAEIVELQSLERCCTVGWVAYDLAQITCYLFDT